MIELSAGVVEPRVTDCVVVTDGSRSIQLKKNSIAVVASLVKGNQNAIMFEVKSNLEESPESLGLAMLVNGMVIAAKSNPEQIIDIGMKNLQEIQAASNARLA